MVNNEQLGVEVRMTTNKRKGVFALRLFRKGETIVTARVRCYTDGQTAYTYQVDMDKHFIADADSNDPSILMNHSCQPNTGAFPNESGGYDFKALHDIASGEEIVWDYATTDYDSVAMRDLICGCDADACRGVIGGWASLPDPVKEHYRSIGCVATYLLERP